MNESETEAFLLENLGPKQYDFNTAIPMTVIYSAIFMTGMVGNSATCIVIARNQYMQTVGQYRKISYYIGLPFLLQYINPSTFSSTIIEGALKRKKAFQ